MRIPAIRGNKEECVFSNLVHSYKELVSEDAVDSITDFVVADDTINVYAPNDPFYDQYFGGGLTSGAPITADQLKIGSAAADASHRFIYNQNTGALYFDVDGTGTAEQVQFAWLSAGLGITNADISVIG